MAEIASNDFLDEGLLMERYRLGRTPLREALKRLSYEHFIIWPPHRTPYVRALTPADTRQLTEARLATESAAARLATERASASEVARLRSLISEMQEAEGQGDLYELVELDYAFHSHVAHMTKNKYLADAVDNLNCSSLRLWYTTNKVLGYRNVGDRHIPILVAISSDDPDIAENSIRDHIVRSLERHDHAVNVAF